MHYEKQTVLQLVKKTWKIKFRVWLHNCPQLVLVPSQKNWHHAFPADFLKARSTGRFIMLSVITNIYNKKTKGPALMELFTATAKLKKFFFFTSRNVLCVHHGWHGTHRYDIQVLATHASTWEHRYSSLLQWSVPLGQRGHMAMLGRISMRTLHEMHVAQ